MQAFALNIRRDQFKDPRVRRALNYAFDFEEMNKQIFFGQYKRISSYFDGTELASSGLPEGKELEILEAVRAEVPPEVFTKPYTNPVGGSPEAVRENLREALRLLKEAGYEVRERKLVDSKTGAQFALELLGADPVRTVVLLSCNGEIQPSNASCCFSSHLWSDSVSLSACEQSIRHSMKIGFAAGISMWSSRRGRNPCHPEMNSANIGVRKRRTWRVRAISSASRIRRSTN